jgi:hypothetical protein
LREKLARTIAGDPDPSLLVFDELSFGTRALKSIAGLGSHKAGHSLNLFRAMAVALGKPKALLEVGTTFETNPARLSHGGLDFADAPRRVSRAIQEVLDAYLKVVGSPNFTLVRGYAEEKLTGTDEANWHLDASGAWIYSPKRLELSQSAFRALKPGGESRTSVLDPSLSLVRWPDGRTQPLVHYMAESAPHLFSIERPSYRSTGLDDEAILVMRKPVDLPFFWLPHRLEFSDSEVTTWPGSPLKLPRTIYDVRASTW